MYGVKILPQISERSKFTWQKKNTIFQESLRRNISNNIWGMFLASFTVEEKKYVNYLIASIFLNITNTQIFEKTTLIKTW